MGQAAAPDVSECDAILGEDRELVYVLRLLYVRSELLRSRKRGIAAIIAANDYLALRVRDEHRGRHPAVRPRAVTPPERAAKRNAGSEQAVLIARAASQWADGVGGAAALSPAGLGFLQSSGSDSLRFELLGDEESRLKNSSTKAGPPGGRRGRQ